ncbi:hypothetical protein Desaf_3583 [Desulfocurvibacter africanus subsp. africanus str. Walvis Bay]|uniref:Uncharacterized protein n=1 Tax=Desulfocurvibacter africanus subsp. africanus str. Walvis Bay TaxID=690850 RepID=F3YY86_DESAF|nr:hypothetical protein Desaf_3583 [Desulfocurvibacter africanus subsp. africanus str. Walvis Bay]
MRKTDPELNVAAALYALAFVAAFVAAIVLATCWR